MSGAPIAALIAAGAFVLLVVLLAIPILKLGRTLDEATLTLRRAREDVGPILTSVQSTMQQVNAELERVDGIAANAQSVSSNAAALSSVVASTLGGPLVKIAAMSFGIRQAASNRRKAAEERANGPARRPGRRHSRSGGGS